MTNLAQVHVLVDPEVLQNVKAKGGNISQICRDALIVYAAIPKTEEAILEQLREAETRVNMLKSESVNFNSFKEKELIKDKAREQESDKKILRQAFIKKLADPSKENLFNKILRLYCEKWNCELVEALAVAEWKPKSADVNKPFLADDNLPEARTGDIHD